MKDAWKAVGVAMLVLASSAGIAAYVAVREPPGGPRHDGRWWVLAARERMEGERYDEAARAYENAIAASRKVALDPQVWCELADAIGMSQGGRLAGRPRELVAKALALDGNHPRALEMAGSAAYEARDYGLALSYWEPLLAALPAGTQERAELSAAIARTKELRANPG